MTLRRESAAYAFDGHYCDSHAPFSSALLLQAYMLVAEHTTRLSQLGHTDLVALISSP